MLPWPLRIAFLTYQHFGIFNCFLWLCFLLRSCCSCCSVLVVFQGFCPSPFLCFASAWYKGGKLQSGTTDLVLRAYDTRHRLTLPDQRTEELLIWGYAISEQHRVMAWLGPACSSQAPFCPGDSTLAIRCHHAYCPASRHTIF